MPSEYYVYYGGIIVLFVLFLFVLIPLGIVILLIESPPRCGNNETRTKTSSHHRIAAGDVSMLSSSLTDEVVI